MKDESEEKSTTDKSQRLRETFEEDYGYPLYPERKNPELFKEYSALNRRSASVVEKKTVKCFTHCKFSNFLGRIFFIEHIYSSFEKCRCIDFVL